MDTFNDRPDNEPQHDRETVLDSPENFPSSVLVDLVLDPEKDLEKVIPTLIARNEVESLFELGSKYHSTYWIDLVEKNAPNELLLALAEKFRTPEKRVTDFDRNIFKKLYVETERELQAYIHYLNIRNEEIKYLDKGNLLLIGGGESPVKEGLLKMNIDTQVTNIDPFMYKENNANNADIRIHSDYLYTRVDNEFNEIWALYSIPNYALSPEQVDIFFEKSLTELKQGGTLRVIPIDDFKESFDIAMRLTRKPVMTETARYIDLLKTRPDLFAVDEYKIDQTIYPNDDGYSKGIIVKQKGLTVKVISSPEDVASFFLEIKSESKK